MNAPAKLSPKSSAAAAVALKPEDYVDGDRLREQLTASFREHDGDEMKQRAAALAIFKDAMTTGRATIREALERGMKGLKTAEALSHLQDVLIQALYDYCRVHVFPSPHHTKAENICIVAVGGYGRGTLAPGSDIDLLFLLPYKQTPWGESVVEYMLYMLWDLGLKVGHATRSVDDCIRLAKEDITIRTTVLEARYLWGHQELYDNLMDKFWNNLVPGTGREFVTKKLAERNERHQRAGQSRYLVEPNIKESKGGLRDLNTLFWIGKYLYGVQDPGELVKKGVFKRDEMRLFRKAEEFLWAVRCHLHFLTGRAEDRLTFDVQIEMARRLGYVTHGGMRDVERFMKHYFLVAKDVGDLTRILCAGLEEQQKKAQPKPVTGLRQHLKPLMDVLSRKPKDAESPGRTRIQNAEGFEAEGGRLKFTRDDAIERDPVNIIRLFHIAEMAEADIHPDALKLVRRSLKYVDAKLRRNDVANRLFREILTSPKTPDVALRRMNEAGVLGRFVPDFGRIVALMQFNMYHHYTADEHLINAIRVLSDIEKGKDYQDHPLACDLMKNVQSRDVMYLAMFLHDIAKGRPEDHSVAGAKIARKLGPRLGLTAAETGTVAWLVLNHLVMSDVAQTRDISDPKTVKDFAADVQSPERLKLLTILTVADIKAVGPGVWNGWKGQLIQQLYDETLPHLSGAHAAPSRAARVAAAKEALAERISDLDEDVNLRLAGRHADAYWLAFDTDTHERHARLMANADDDDPATLEIGVAPYPDDDVTEITVYTGDHPGIFSRIAGAVAMTGSDIVDAKIFTTTDGMALDTFWIQADDTGAVDETRRIQRLRDLISKTLRGEMLPKDAIAKERKRTRRQQAFEIEPQVLIDNTVSDRFSVIEVNALDRPGILYDLTRALFHLNLTVASAHIVTYGERIVDVFYVKDVTGGKVVQDGKKQNVIDGLMAAISSKLSPRPPEVQARVEKRQERREAARETGKKARDARTKRLKGAAD